MSRLPDLEHELSAAATRIAVPSGSGGQRPAWRRHAQPGAPGSRTATRRLLVPLTAVVVTIALAGAALAATGIWNPQLGDARRGHPTRASSSPPPEQLALLGVLRRSQTTADRGRQSRYALRFEGPGSVAGVRVGSVRLLGATPRGRGFVLVPVERYNLGLAQVLPPHAPPGLRAQMTPKSDGLCVFARDSDGGGFGCYSTDDVRAGHAAGSLGLDYYGLVPDGVATVRLRFSSGATRDLPVHENFFVAKLAPERVGLHAALSGGRRAPHAGRVIQPVTPVWPASTVWLDRAGRRIGPPAVGAAQTGVARRRSGALAPRRAARHAPR